jgi:hypothetical protein
MRAYQTTAILIGGLALAACNEALVPDFNTPTGYPHTIGSLQSEFTGIFSNMRVEEGRLDFASEAFSRSAAYYTPSEVRYVTEWTGGAPLDDDGFGALVWNTEYTAAKDADSLEGTLQTLVGPTGAKMPAANLNALLGVVKTIKAMDYMFVVLSHDTNGVAMNAPGQPYSGTLAPILCARDGWREIVAMLDSAKAELDAAGPTTVLGWPGTEFPTMQVPPGFASVSANAGAYEAFTLALLARARIEYAYAIARGPGGNAPTVTSPGSPDQAQLDSAITEITASAIYSPNLSAGEAIPQNDVGVFFSYSSAAGDLQNQNFAQSAAIYALEGAVQQIDTLHDQRFLAKFAPASSQPTSAGALLASSYVMTANLSPSTPQEITRNLELQFLLARAYLGTGQFVKAAQTVDAVRTIVGGLASGLPSVNTSDYVSVRDFLMREMLPTLIKDGQGEQIDAVRDYGLIMQDLTSWEFVPKSDGGGTDYHTSMENIPAIERQQRHNNYLPVCP